jgi:hypothetical protein
MMHDHVLTHVNVHLLATPTRLSELESADWEQALSDLSPQDVASCCMQQTFEAVADRLQSLNRMFFEMDGSFVWTGNSSNVSGQDVRWQLDGMLYDVGGHVQRMELKGTCFQPHWRQLLATLGWPNQPLIAYDLVHSLFMSIDSLELSLWNDAS